MDLAQSIYNKFKCSICVRSIYPFLQHDCSRFSTNLKVQVFDYEFLIRLEM